VQSFRLRTHHALTRHRPASAVRRHLGSAACFRPPGPAPVAAVLLEPPQRLPLWVNTLGRFFVWVWLAVIILLGTGYWLGFQLFGGFATFRWYVNLMQGIGILMMCCTCMCTSRLTRNCVARSRPATGRRQPRSWRASRRTIGINLILGLSVVTIAGGGVTSVDESPRMRGGVMASADSRPKAVSYGGFAQPL